MLRQEIDQEMKPVDVELDDFLPLAFVLVCVVPGRETQTRLAEQIVFDR